MTRAPTLADVSPSSAVRAAVDEFNDCCMRWEKCHKTGLSLLSSLVSFGGTMWTLPEVGSINLDLQPVNAEACLGALRELLDSTAQLLGEMETLCRRSQLSVYQLRADDPIALNRASRPSTLDEVQYLSVRLSMYQSEYDMMVRCLSEDSLCFD
jgi:hypothetical protein